MRGGTSKMSATPFEQYDPVNYRLDQLSFSAYLNEEAEDNQWQRQALRQALGRAIREELTGRQREVLLLYYLDQLTMQQVAERSDAPAGRGPPASVPALRGRAAAAPLGEPGGRPGSAHGQAAAGESLPRPPAGRLPDPMRREKREKFTGFCAG